MAIIRWRPFHALEDLINDKFMYTHGFDLAVDMYEEGNNVIAKMNIPGVKAEDIEIKIERHHLHIYGERKEEKEVKDKEYYHKEIRSGRFERAVSLPCHVNEHEVTADLHNGVLIVTMPKSKKEEKEGRSIKVTQK